MTILERVQRILKVLFDMVGAPGISLVSLDAMERRVLAMAVEIDFEIDLPDDLEDNWRTVSDVVVSAEETK